MTESERECGSRKSVSLPVLAKRPAIRKSRMGARRAAVLIGVHILIGIHILHWVVFGMTLSPVEPSESMYTINLGKVNTGFVFFVLAIGSTLVLGRFFCGWGCHVVALQDLCGWAMKKAGVKPKPLRSRLLIWAPMVLAVYMFAWPTIKREVIKPIAGESGWAHLAPYLGEAGVRPEIQNAFVTEHFWETFPPWYVAIPFLLACGFACVYFLGAKGYCTYGCPYGGVFAPADRLAVGRIRVTDACEHCGHCTAVCTSNVRVHEEVRDYGMVIDPGCMKCMDCVSVCPNEALYFGFGKPAIGAKAKSGSAPHVPHFKSRVYDFSWKEEAAYGGLFLVLVVGFRGMLDFVPLLMAMGLAGIGTFLAWKMVSMVRLPNVRVQNVQLKLKGTMRPAGVLIGVGAIAMVCAGGWGAIVNASLWRGNSLDARIATPLSEVISPGYVAGERDRAIARRALLHLERAGPWEEGGFGWDESIDRTLRVARLRGIVGDHSGAERALRVGLSRHSETGAIEDPLVMMLSAKASTSQELEASLRGLLSKHPGLSTTALRLALVVAERGGKEEAIGLAARAMEGGSERNIAIAANVLAQLGEADRAVRGVEKAVGSNPHSAALQETLGLLLAGIGRVDEGLNQLKKAVEIDPKRTSAMRHIAALLRELGREADATAWEERANQVSQDAGADPR